MKILICLAIGMAMTSCALQTDMMTMQDRLYRLEKFVDSIDEDVKINANVNLCWHKRCR